MQVDEWVSVKTAGGSPRTGKILAAETFNEGIMYLVALEEYPRGIWFFNENNTEEGIFVQPIQAPAG
ncbi:DsrB family protein [Tatumella ptyseos ATCC 33301]|uniref:DsrB family protein n=1 Tax=Tatumella ptyseos ATCC 33301 TaxID=1005995 RepID=A0A085JF24_9GAMM|nr:protein DsrB [Tatumella ptyseos]KFD19070.1 DsrB family protein [Tatumella ptyseos ATCC 33301]